MLHGTARTIACKDGPLCELGARLTGPVLVRFSSAWWKRVEWPDLLGCAVRFTNSPDFSHPPHDSDQDVLLATVKHPLTLALAPWTTHVSDYLSNDYFGVSPFRTPEAPRLWLRLKPLRPGGLEGRTRESKLSIALAGGPITLQLQARTQHFSGSFEDIVVIDLVERVDIDQRTFSFDPFQNGRGLKPDGFLHAARAASYAASRGGRRPTEPAHAPAH